MELLRGGAEATTDPHPPTDARPAGGPAPAGPSFPTDTARTLSMLAHLIDDAITVRGVGFGVREWAAAFLGVPVTELVTTTIAPSVLDTVLASLALAGDLEAHPPVGVIGCDQEEPAEWERLELGELVARIPVALAARFAPGTLLDAPVVVEVENPYRAPGLRFRVHSRPGDAEVAAAYLDDLLARGRDLDNPFRGRVLETVFTQIGLSFRVVGPVAAGRDDVVVPARVWEVLDRNVTGLFAGLDRLRGAGLATNRGILLTGPPGTGKTALCRVLAAELAGSATVVFCDATSVQHALPLLYRELRRLGPSVVVMEDVDLVIGDRAGGASSALLDFLLALDGAMSEHEGVVTIATTNDPGSLDAAACRSARLDVVVEVPPPSAEGRAAILERYLRDVTVDSAGIDGSGVDVVRVAAATEGLTGADLRELVSDAVLHVVAAEQAGQVAAVDTAALLRLAAARRPAPLPGLYL